MSCVVVFHSMLGLRRVEIDAADLFRAAGHEVVTPDLYAGEVAASPDEGFALKNRIGWPTILPDRPDTAGVLLLHGLAEIPTGLPVQVHIADPDPIAPPAKVTAWHAKATSAAAHVFTYPGAGHFYTDADSPDYDEQATTLTWQRALAFLDAHQAR